MSAAGPQPHGGASAYPPPTPLLPDRLSGWGRFRRTLALTGLAAVVVACFRTAPYISAVLLTTAVLLARGASHSRQAGWQRRSLRGPRWFDGPLALAAYPWHVLRGSFGSLLLVAVAGAVTAGLVTVMLLAGSRPREALLVGGIVLVLGTWAGPGSTRLREPVGRAATGVARHPAVWWLIMAALVVLAATWWWRGDTGGVIWDPATGPPTDSLRELADLVGLRNSSL